ncbi:ATP-binding protein [Candidatus Saccharibacteria bacterium]|nr:ATP-binding protein [Candidatus Saccharibacteria bacterium]
MQNHSKPTFALFCGLPGSGKTTLAKQLEKQGKGIRICTDDWQEDLAMQHDNQEFHGLLRNRLYAHALELLKNGQSIILEDGLWMVRDRTEKLEGAQASGAVTELHFFDLTFDQLWSRIQVRNEELPHGAVPLSKETLQECWDKFEKPTPEELAKFDKVFIYNEESPHPEH